eukprot:jgi/Botrbrau1/10657/Bobra.53_2s0015.1
MVVKLYKIPVGSTIRDRNHKGPLQAGNKSAASFRTDIGVPGYTGFIPQSKALPVDAKTIIGHFSPEACNFTHQRSRPELDNDDREKTMYRKQFEFIEELDFTQCENIHQHCCKADSATLPPSKPFVGKTTYATTLGLSPSTPKKNE